jgi:hypothetical protein
MRMVIRHLALALIPLVVGVAAGWVFAHGQPGCSSMVGPLFAPKCGRALAQYQLRFQTVGTAAGCLLSALIGIWLEWRRTARAARAAQAPPPPPLTA